MNLLPALPIFVATSLASAISPPLVPLPGKISPGEGTLILTARSQISYTDPEFAPLAKILRNGLTRTTGITLEIGDTASDTGSIIFKKHTPGAVEHYRVTIGDNVLVESSSYQGMAYGAATILQLTGAHPPAQHYLSLPRLSLSDTPAYPFRAVMLDVARQLNRITDIENTILLCHLYKIRYLHIHLSDNQGWVFPSTTFPELGSKNTAAHGGTPPRRLTSKEMAALVSFGDHHGVTLIPELDFPGHAMAMLRARPDIFDPANTGVINVATQPVYDAIDTLIDELATTFSSSPYIHFGTDEVNLKKLYTAYKDDPWTTSRGITGHGELFTAFQEEMVRIIEKHGKRPLAWEGHRPAKPTETLRRITWMNWAHGTYLPDAMIADGYDIINASWAPLYEVQNQVWVSQKKVYDWDIHTWGNYKGVPRLLKTVPFRSIPPSPQVKGACFCSWENPGYHQISGLRAKVPAMAERVWNPGLTTSYENFQKRWFSTDAVLTKLLAGRIKYPSFTGGAPGAKTSAYESFSAAGLDGNSGSGFASGSKWGITRGSGDTLFETSGLVYKDKKGRALATAGGAVTISSKEKNVFFTRRLASPLPAGGGAGYWVSFLIRPNTTPITQAFWSPDGTSNHGGFGFQGTRQLRQISAAYSSKLVEEGETVFIVLNLQPDQVARVWINPDLESPGTPDFINTRGALPTTTDAVFTVGSGGTFTVDELRFGNSFLTVAPGS